MFHSLIINLKNVYNAHQKIKINTRLLAQNLRSHYKLIRIFITKILALQSKNKRTKNLMKIESIYNQNWAHQFQEINCKNKMIIIIQRVKYKMEILSLNALRILYKKKNK
jgi:hypothetical protein